MRLTPNNLHIIHNYCDNDIFYKLLSLSSNFHKTNKRDYYERRLSTFSFARLIELNDYDTIKYMKCGTIHKWYNNLQTNHDHFRKGMYVSEAITRSIKDNRIAILKLMLKTYDFRYINNRHIIQDAIFFGNLKALKLFNFYGISIKNLHTLMMDKEQISSKSEEIIFENIYQKYLQIIMYTLPNFIISDNNYYKYIFDKCCENGNVVLLEYLIRQNIYGTRYSLMKALRNDNTEIVKILRKKSKTTDIYDSNSCQIM